MSDVTEEVADPFAETAEPEKSKFEKQVDILDPVADAVDVELTHPVTGETKTFTQKELAFIPKTRLLSLVATTLRAASDSDGNIGEIVGDMFGGVNNLISQGVSPEDAESFATNQLLNVVLRLVEITPDFLDQLFLLVLGVKKNDRQFALDALEEIDDELGMSILDTAIAQNGDALKNFFDQHLRKLVSRVTGIVNVEDTGQE